MTIARAICPISALSAARTRQLVSGALGTPPKLTVDPLRRHGLLMQPAAAGALLAECRQRGAPASRESVAVDAMEDHVSMAALAARQALDVVGLARRVVTHELVCAAQGLDFAGVEDASVPARGPQRRARAPGVRRRGPLRKR